MSRGFPDASVIGSLLLDFSLDSIDLKSKYCDKALAEFISKWLIEGLSTRDVSKPSFVNYIIISRNTLSWRSLTISSLLYVFMRLFIISATWLSVGRSLVTNLFHSAYPLIINQKIHLQVCLGRYLPISTLRSGGLT